MNVENYEKRLKRMPRIYREILVSVMIESLVRLEPAVVENFFINMEGHVQTEREAYGN